MVQLAAVAAGRWDEGLRHQAFIDAAFGIISRRGHGNYPTVKAMMKVLGLPAGRGGRAAAE